MLLSNVYDIYHLILYNVGVFDNVYLTFCRIGLQTPLRRWDIVILVCGTMLGRLRSCELLDIWHNVGEGEILWASGYMAQCWRGWDLLIFWVCGTMLERVRSCDLLVRGTIFNSVRSCDILGVWDHVEEGEILWYSGYVGTCWEGWDLVIFWVCGTNLEGCDIVIFWVFSTKLGSVRKNYVSTELLFFIDPLQISQIINKWTKSTIVIAADGEKLQFREKYFSLLGYIKSPSLWFHPFETINSKTLKSTWDFWWSKRHWDMFLR